LGVRTLSVCPQCGQENKEGAKFCLRCGSPLGASQQQAAPPAQAGAAPSEAAPPPPQAAPPITPPSQVAPTIPPSPAPGGYPSPTPPGAYTRSTPPAPGAAAYSPAQPAYGAVARTRRPIFWLGSSLVLIAGAVVLISTWLSWGGGSGGIISLTGWDWFDLGRTLPAAPGEVTNAFFIYSEGYPLFTGLCSLIAGALIALIGIIMLLTRSKGLGVLAIIFSLLALGMAVTNLTTILRGDNISMGVGMYLFLIFSLAGLVGGVSATAG
jgi:hypothetical protein